MKRFLKGSKQGATEFKNEVIVVAKLQRNNLVGLLGFYMDGEEKILIYEFAPNKSLNYIFFSRFILSNFPAMCLLALDFVRLSNFQTN